MRTLLHLRSSAGFFTRLPVGRMDPDAFSPAAIMLASPLIGILLAAGSATVGGAVLLTGRPGAPWLAAAAAVSVSAYLTRGLHLDGLADTADGLGARCDSRDAVSVMQRPDVGAFGAITLVLVLVLQIALLGSIAAAAGWPGMLAAMAVAMASARCGAVLLCRCGAVAAPGSALGAWVAGTVPTAAAWGLAAALAAVAGLLGIAGTLAVAAACLVALGTGRTASRRFGGITGDVLGAAVELGHTAALFVLLAMPG